MEYNFLYKRGFLLTKNQKKELSLKNNWEKIYFSNYLLYADESLEITSFCNDIANVLIVGIILNPFDNTISRNKIAETIAERFSISEIQGFDYIDELSGRFFIIYQDEKREYLLQDAIGSRSIFYDKTSFIVSSHAEIIADIMDYRVSDGAKIFMNSDYFKKNKDRYFPGISTPYDEIKMLTPNTLINLKNKNIERFFPRENLNYQDIDKELVTNIGTALEKQILLLTLYKNIAISLTAGLDSRLTLATSKNSKNIMNYTLIYNEASKFDDKVANDLSQKLNLQHITFKDTKALDSEFLDLFLKNTSNMSSEFRGRIGYNLYNNYPENYLHIKSNASEICRSYYRQAYKFLPKKISSKVYSRLYGINDKNNFVKKAFEEYITVTNLNKDTLYNYDHYDLFYWEIKIGNWQSLCLLEWDIAQDTFIPFGNRKILKDMLGIELKKRMDDSLYYEIINFLWADCLLTPINPNKKNKYSKIISKIKKYLKGFSMNF